MSIEVSMPQMGESVAEGTLVKWHKKIGDRIDRDEILFEISTDKVDTEIPSPEEGYLERVLVAEGETVPVHTVVCCISKVPPAASSSGEGHGARSAGASGGADAPDAASQARRAVGAAGSSPLSAPRSTVQMTGAPPARSTPVPPASQPQPSWSGERVLELARERTSPLVRRLAAEQGIDISRVQGTGIGGRVTKDDIVRHLDLRARGPAGLAASPDHGSPLAAPADVPAHAPPPLGPPPPAVAPAAAAAPAPAPSANDAPLAAPLAAPAAAPAASTTDVSAPAPAPIDPEAAGAAPGDRVEPMPLMRQKIAEHMLASRRTSAHVTTIFEVDLTPVRELRSFFAERFEEKSGARLTFLPFIIQAVARSLRKFPVLNASIDGKNVRFRGNVNIGIAVALENGLVVPVIRQADTKDLGALARSVQDLARRARSKDLCPDEVKDGTFTITNPGVFGSIIGTPIIHQPQVAILCVGAVVKRPVVLPGTDAIAVRSMAYFSLTFDHRLIDGAIGDRFLGDIKSTLENASFDGLSGLK